MQGKGRGLWMSPGAKVSVVVLFVMAWLLAGAAYWQSVAYYNREQSAQHAQGAAFEAKLCATLGRLAALKPPPGSAAGNPSRAYLQQEHQVLAELGPDVGCK